MGTVLAHDLIHDGLVELTRDGHAVTMRSVTSGQATAYLSRGWFDVQINGFAGHDVNAGGLGPDGFAAMTRALHAEGVARYLPTVVTASVDHMGACLAAVTAARRADPAVAFAVLGIHLEGPFVSPEDGARGAHPLAAVRDPDPAVFDDLQARADGAIRIVTLAPERPGALELISYLAGHGIVVSIGHSLADAAVVHEAAGAGARLSTHLGNGLPATLPRHPNLLWAQLADDRLHASMIFDGHHLPEDTMRVFLRAKGPERTILTSDAVALARCHPGVYEGQVGGTVELHDSGRLTMVGTPYLAGSASSLADAMSTATGRLGVPVADAARMVTEVPRGLLWLDAADDATVFRVEGGRVVPVWTVVDGRVVYAREGHAS
ncbi:MAG: hypothetical protein U5K81_16145 [Trueperaceae bacterium]|nr:hypothetical protein [Trueperaceae bacterium]